MRLARAEQSCATLTMPNKRDSDTIRLATVQCTQKNERQRGGHNSHHDAASATAEKSNLSATQGRQTLPEFAEKITHALDAIGADVDQRAKKSKLRLREQTCTKKATGVQATPPTHRPGPLSCGA